MAGTMLNPIPAASVIAVRDDPFEVLMLRRHAHSSFAPDAWVFPGGAVERSDDEAARRHAGGELMTMRFTAARETFEETGIWLGAPLPAAEEKRAALLRGEMAFDALVEQAPIDLEGLVWTSRWITPEGLPKRFDTWFFVASVPHGVEVTAQPDEAVDVAWIAPSAALAGSGMKMMFPTLRNLEAIAGFRTSRELIEARRGAVITPVQPILVDGKPTLP